MPNEQQQIDANLVLPDWASERMLSLSTGHIRKESADALGNQGRALVDEALLWNKLVYEPWDEFGWIICTYKSSEEEALAQQYPELIALLKFARDRGYAWLRLDCDIPAVPGLPFFEW